MVKDMRVKKEEVKVDTKTKKKSKLKVKHLRMEEIKKNNSIEVDHTIRKIKEREFKLTLMFVCIFLVVLISSTLIVGFSIQTFKEYNKVSSGDLIISYDENDNMLDDVITLDNNDVMSYDEGLESDTYKFTITNDTDTNIRYIVKIVRDYDMIELDECSDMLFSDENIMISLDGKFVGMLADFYDGNEYIICEDRVETDSSHTYELGIWVDENYVNNGHYHGKIVVEEKK